MICPDNLLIASRKGQLTEDERQRLDAHVAQCATCRLTLRAGADFDALLETLPGDELIAARMAKNLTSRFVNERAQPRTGSRAPWAAFAGSTVRVAAAAFVLLAGAGLVAAASLNGWRIDFGNAEASPSASPPTSTDTTRPSTQRVPGVSAVQAPARTADEVALPAPTSAAEAQGDDDEGRVQSAAVLFERANTLRREGQAARARHLYRELQARHPRAPEVEVSFVSLGRVCLDLGDAREALRQFERYLSRHPRGALAEEALFGQASALERLQRHAAERETWQRLLSTFPQSIYADRARHRLEHMP